MPLFLSKGAFKNLMSICGVKPAKLRVSPAPCAVADDASSAQVQRTPEEAKARRKAYRRRKAAKAARRRNRK